MGISHPFLVMSKVLDAKPMTEPSLRIVLNIFSIGCLVSSLTILNISFVRCSCFSNSSPTINHYIPNDWELAYSNNITDEICLKILNDKENIYFALISMKELSEFNIYIDGDHNHKIDAYKDVVIDIEKEKITSRYTPTGWWTELTPTLPQVLSSFNRYNKESIYIINLPITMLTDIDFIDNQISIGFQCYLGNNNYWTGKELYGASFGCADGNLIITNVSDKIIKISKKYKKYPKISEALDIRELMNNLNYPKALWIKDDYIYLTETSKRNTGYGDPVLTLLEYNINTKHRKLLKNYPSNSDALVASNFFDILYLSSYKSPYPGERGTISFFNLNSNIESHLVDIEIATSDMFIDRNDNIFIIGSSDNKEAKSIVKLPKLDYKKTIVLKKGLGRFADCIAKNSGYIYYSNQDGIMRLRENEESELYYNKVVSSMSFSPYYLYYTPAFPFNSSIGRININTKDEEIILSNLKNVGAIRYDYNSRSLYFLELGKEKKYNKGTLKVIKNLN